MRSRYHPLVPKPLAPTFAKRFGEQSLKGEMDFGSFMMYGKL
jgi:hypothetical protein